MAFRAVVRSKVPLPIRRRIRQACRRAVDMLRGVRLAGRRGEPGEFPHLVCEYARPLICYPGQQAQFAAKQHNVELALTSINELVIAPGETFSFWQCVGEPTVDAGYLPAAALKNRVLTQEVGGALCLASTLLYNIGLLGGLAIIERRCHSIDQYGDRRYFELGRDAAVEYAYLDLRFKNFHRVPVLLSCSAGEAAVVAHLWSQVPLQLAVDISVDLLQYEQPQTVRTADSTLPRGTAVVDDPGLLGVTVRTTRRIEHDGSSREEDLGVSVHHASPRRERYRP